MAAKYPIVQKAFVTIQTLSCQILLLDATCKGIDFFISEVQIFYMGTQVLISSERFITKFAVDGLYFFLQLNIVLG